MKKLLLSAIALMVLASCINKPNVDTKTTQHKVGSFGEEVDVVTIEGCEYFVIQYDRSMSMCHKGNCRNPIHKLQEQ
jgi:hypothetical protein